MTDGPPGVPAADAALGIGFYLSRAPGIGGRLKASPEEFVVQEVSSYPRPDPEGPFTVLRVESRGWEQHELADAIGRRLGLPRRALSWAGTKDRRAVAERLFSYRGAPPSGDLGLSGVQLRDAYRARERLVLGQHYGNAFAIHLREVGPTEPAVRACREVEAQLRAAGGLPNFFGAQRFGEVRPITHVVGRWLVRGELPGAVDAYLIDRPPTGSAGTGDAARAAYAEHRDPVRALREFPPEYRFERAMLERLARGETPERALRALPFELRRLFVHAYQAYLFNRYLSARYAAELPLDRPVPGDAILRLGRDGTYRGRDHARVREENLGECADLVARGRAAVAGPLVGLETQGPEDRPGALWQRLLAEEGVAPAAFGVPVAPELASAGTWRPLLLPLPPLAMAPDPDGIWFRFALPKGAYATVLLREFRKSPAEVPGGPPAAESEPTGPTGPGLG